ncbi:MAG TPA: DUF4331 family protein [Actinomycetota bacterium]|nr:DUF4331 family protein [Actinomycetota bacterium]
MNRKRTLLGSAIAASALTLALGAAPMIGFGADHLDAPGLTSPATRSDGDINDVYVFEGRDDTKTAIVVTTHPAAGAIAPLAYATDLKYTVKIDRNGDAMSDVQYTATFGEPRSNGRQRYWVVRRSGDEQRPVAHGLTGAVNQVRGGGKSFAGLRSDPFFFDLAAFQGSVLGMGGRAFCDGDEVDFFESLNTNAIVLQVPDSALGRHIGVWAVTTTEDGDRIDRMGRPAINTVFNSGQDKVRFNNGYPASDYRRFSGNVRGVLKTFSALDTEGAYTNAQTRTLAKVLLPDVVTYDTRTDAAGPLNGRALADDVIDAELNIVTGGFPFDGRDADGAIGSDCVGPHDDYQKAFPYLGEPHA